MSSTIHRPLSVTLVVWTFWFGIFGLPVPGRAAKLEGHLTLGRGLHIYLEEHEGLILGILRRVSLVRTPVQVHDLTLNSDRPGSLFVGSDRVLYGRDSENNLWDLGFVKSPDQVCVHPDVALVWVDHMSNRFAGVGPERTVDFRADPERRTDRVVEPAGFEFWLRELESLAQAGAFEEESDLEARAVLDLVAGALPCALDSGSDLLNHVAHLRFRIESGKIQRPDIFRRLIDQVQKDIRMQALEGEAFADEAGIKRMLESYERMRGILGKRSRL